MSANTARAYKGHLSRLNAWLNGKELTDTLLRNYLHVLEAEGKAPASIGQAVSAFRFRARINGQPSPVGSRTERALKRIRRDRAERGRGQSLAVTAADIRAILVQARQPRRRGKGMETARVAEMRGIVDAAIAAVLFQAGLRRSEAAALKWRDIEPASDCRGALLVRVRKSKTNQGGRAADVRLVKNECARALEALRALQPHPAPDSEVFGLDAGTIGRRFMAAAKAAGIAGRITAHSARVGLASELTRRGASITETMLAGGWKSARMVAHYSAGAVAEQGAVAKYL